MNKILLLIIFCFFSVASADDLVITPAPCRGHIAGLTYRCSYGKNGITFHKREGDLKTPIGIFPLRAVYYRADRLAYPLETGLPTHSLFPNDGWSDDMDSPCYNQKVSVTVPGSHERLWRDDYLYDILVDIGYNDHPIIRGKGSAIFIHVARPNYRPTIGCIAFAKVDLIQILRHLDRQSRIIIRGGKHVSNG